MRSPAIESMMSERLLRCAGEAGRGLKILATGLLLVGLAGCQNLSAGMPASQVRIIDTSADAPDLDIYQGGSALAYNLGFGTVSSYVSIAPGATIVSAHAAGTKQPLSSFHGSFTASRHYTVLVSSGPTGAVSETLLADQSVAAPAGLASVRIIDQARRGAADMDIYLVRGGATLGETRPMLTHVSFGENSEYVNVPAGAYRVIVVPAGSTAPAYSGATASYNSGSARTLVLLDSQRMDGQRVQVVTAEDFDAEAVVE